MNENKNLLISFSILIGVSLSVYLAIRFLVPDVSQLEQMTLAKADWKKTMLALAPINLCADHGYFLNCFELEPSQCQQAAMDVGQECLITIDSIIPDPLKLPEDGARLGARFGSCVETSFEFQLKDQKKDDKDCANSAVFARQHPPPSVTKAAFMFSMEADFTEKFCHPKSFFRHCFLVDDQECQEVATEVISNCLQTLEPKIPAALKPPLETTYWGGRIGECAGRAYESKLADRRMQSPQCQ